MGRRRERVGVDRLGCAAAGVSRLPAPIAPADSESPILVALGTFLSDTGRKDEIDKRAYHKMLKQLCLSEKDFD